MSHDRERFSASIPELYDRYLGPVLFEPYAKDLTRRVTGQPDGPVLEIACGTGILTRELRAKLPAGTPLVATDLSESMLACARAKRPEIRDVEWRLADASALPFPAASFAAVACQFGLMFIPDKAVAISECRRVLVHGGILALNVWDSLEHNPYAKTVHETVARFFPNDPPGFFKRTPWGFYDPDVLRGLLETHGFGQVRVERVTLEARSPSAEALAMGLVRGNPLAKEIDDRKGRNEEILAAATEALARLGGDTPFRSTMQAIVATGRA